MTASRFMPAAPAHLSAVVVTQPGGPPRRGDWGHGGPRGGMTAAAARLGEREDTTERGGGPGGSLWGLPCTGPTCGYSPLEPASSARPFRKASVKYTALPVWVR